jgi:hypothetical protein
VAAFFTDAAKLNIGKVICDRIKTAEIRYLDEYGNAILTHDIGLVKPGGQIIAMIPTPEDFVK